MTLSGQSHVKPSFMFDTSATLGLDADLADLVGLVQQYQGHVALANQPFYAE